jgi:hypothetical protein
MMRIDDNRSTLAQPNEGIEERRLTATFVANEEDIVATGYGFNGDGRESGSLAFGCKARSGGW